MKALFDAASSDWVPMVGRYIINMGSIEATTRMLISIHEGLDRAPAMSADLPSRIGFLKARFPRANSERHSWAMNVFRVTLKHVQFRNIIAHSPLMVTGHEDGSYHIQGIFNLTPNDPVNAGQLVQLEELRERVEESSKLALAFLDMPEDFRRQPPDPTAQAQP